MGIIFYIPSIKYIILPYSKQAYINPIVKINTFSYFIKHQLKHHKNKA